MKSLVVYDMKSEMGTAIALAVNEGIDTCNSTVVDAGDINTDAFEELTLLIVGSPSVKQKPSMAIIKFLDSIPAGALEDINITAFSTKEEKSAEKRTLFSFMSEGDGNVAGQIAGKLRKKGGLLVMPSESFILADSKNPKDGEIERAKSWGQLACHA